MKDRILFGSIAATFGLYSGVLPPDLGKFVATLGGLKGLGDAMSDLNQSLKGYEKARSEDYYFLWKTAK